MIFSTAKKNYCLSGIKMASCGFLSLFLMFTTISINADVIGINNEKNDKVNTGKIAAEAKLIEKVLPERLLYAEQWELARSGEYILSLPVLNQIINSWLQNKQKKIQIQYPGGEEGELWVQELTDWLVALGIPSNHMVIAQGSGADDVIKFDLVK